MIVSLIDMDYEYRMRVLRTPPRHRFPNLALMKLAAWHKEQGDIVDWYPPFMSSPDRIYVSKVFTFSHDCVDFSAGDPEPVYGGTGYRMYDDLPSDVDSCLPDYSIYPGVDYAIGFLSRGCVRRCPWCVVPKKEGNIRRYDDIERISQGRQNVVLMDNNFLANDPDFVREQLEKSVFLKLRIDFNQGLDARLVDDTNAKWLASCNWRAATGNNAYIRFSCDTQSMIPHVQSAISFLRAAGYNGHIFVYFLARDVHETLDRIQQILVFDTKIDPFVMPYRNLDGNGEIEDKKLRDLARWCNIASVRKSCSFDDYKRSVKYA